MLNRKRDQGVGTRKETRKFFRRESNLGKSASFGKNLGSSSMMLVVAGSVCSAALLAPRQPPQQWATSVVTRTVPPVSMVLLGTGGDDMSVPEFVDPLAKPRPKYDLCAASGRPDEVVVGAIAATSATQLEEWMGHMRNEGAPPRPCNCCWSNTNSPCRLTPQAFPGRSPL